MSRFSLNKTKNRPRNMILSVFGFLLVLFLFYAAVTELQSRSVEEQQTNLMQALSQAAVHCYAVEGFYPDTLDYLIEHYGIQYDESLFFVDYQPLGENVMPDITVLRRKTAGGGS